jgi:acyl dehydratase
MSMPDTTNNIETVGLGIPWEDLPVGRKFRTITRTIFECDVMSFVQCTGMVEMIFTSTEFLEKESAIKGRVAPGAMLFTFAEGLLVQAIMQGTGFAFLSMELDIKGPTFIGDTIHVECEVLECRESKGRPGLGLVRTRNTIKKQDGTVVMVYTPLRLVKGRTYVAA